MELSREEKLAQAKEIESVVAGLVASLAAGIIFKNKDKIREVVAVIDNAFDSEPEAILSCFKAALFLSAQLTIDLHGDDVPGPDN